MRSDMPNRIYRGSAPTLSAGVHRFTIFRNGTDWRVARVSAA